MKVIRAAGGLVWRPAAEGLEVLLVHRPRYDDWSLPKGKRHRGERDEDCALREVEEETGLRCRLASELPTVRYLVGLAPKVVRFWAMTAVSGEAVGDGQEVDVVRWLPAGSARDTLDRRGERRVLDAFLAAGTK